jgi:type I restriction enzyme S subunit
MTTDHVFPVAKLADVLARLESGHRPSGGATSESGEVPSIGGENIDLAGRLTLGFVKRVPDSFFSLMRTGHLQTGDVLINKDGAQTGKVAQYRGEYPCAAINEHVFLLRGKPDLLDQGFLFHHMMAAHTQVAIRRYVTGSAQPGLNRSFVHGVTIALPAIRVQRRIAALLDAADEHIAGIERQVRKLERLREGVHDDLLTCGIADDGKLRDSIQPPEQFVDTAFGHIPNTWAVATCEDATSAPIGYGIVQAGDYVSGGVCVLMIRDLDGDFKTDLHRTSPAIDAAYARSRVEPGDVLVSIKATIGRAAVVPAWYTGNISRDIARLRPGPSCLPEFLRMLLSSRLGGRLLAQAVVGTTRAEVSIGVLRKVLIPLPPLDEQRRMTQATESIEMALAARRMALAKHRFVKHGLMEDLLHGRVSIGRKDGAA